MVYERNIGGRELLIDTRESITRCCLHPYGRNKGAKIKTQPGHCPGTNPRPILFYHFRNGRYKNIASKFEFSSWMIFFEKVIKAIFFFFSFELPRTRIDSNFLINSLIKEIYISRLLILNCPKLSRRKFKLCFLATYHLSTQHKYIGFDKRKTIFPRH